MTDDDIDPRRFVRALAGTVVLTGLIGWRFIDPRLLWLTAFAGANLLQSSITGFCPPEIVYERFHEKV